MNKIKVKFTIHDYFLKFVFINLISFILTEKLNNNIRNLHNKNNIKLKLIDDGDVSDNKYLKVFSYFANEYPDSVYLNDEEKDLEDGEYIYISRNHIKETYVVTLEWNKVIDNCEYFFFNLKNVVEIDLSEFDASKVTSMYFMFYCCEN